jgi:hypothetical protein
VAPLHAAEPTSQACARWEDNYRDLVLQVSVAFAATAFALAWLTPLVMASTGRIWRWALGLTGRSLWPGFVLALCAGVGFLLYVLPGPLRGQLSALQIQAEYFPAAPPDASKARASNSASSPASGTARSTDCTTVNFSKRGLLFRMGTGETLAAQPFLVLSILLGSVAAGALGARTTYWLVGRFRGPLARGRRAAREGRRLEH